MLLHDARRDARTTPDGDAILLESQDRSRWDRAQIAEGLDRIEAALQALARPSTYAVQAAIAALHMRAPRYEDTDWPQIAALYEVLMRIHPSPVIELNHAVAVSMVDGPERALRAGRIRSASAANSTATICCRPCAAICCGASAGATKRRRLSAGARRRRPRTRAAFSQRTPRRAYWKCDSVHVTAHLIAASTIQPKIATPAKPIDASAASFDRDSSSAATAGRSNSTASA